MYVLPDAIYKPPVYVCHYALCDNICRVGFGDSLSYSTNRGCNKITVGIDTN